jgi:Fe-Mn family superoxide dismutase
MAHETYKARQFDLSGLHGISDKTLEVHFKLYEGYVKNTNLLTEQLAEISNGSNKPTASGMAFSELTRRLGYEFNGMVLHEYYFGNLKKAGGDDVDRNSPFARAVQASFGDYGSWKKDFFAVGNMRGVGWAICYQDPLTGFLSNHWIELHQDGNIAGFNPILVMDVWEHAFLLDYKPEERPKYIDAFFANIDWSVVNGRIKQPQSESAKIGR